MLQARSVEPLANWKLVSSGTLHALYGLKTPVSPDTTSCVDEEKRPHTFVGPATGKKGDGDFQTSKNSLSSYEFF